MARAGGAGAGAVDDGGRRLPAFGLREELTVADDVALSARLPDPPDALPASHDPVVIASAVRGVRLPDGLIAP